MYKTYCEDAKVLYPLSRRPFNEELKNYFWNFYDRYTLEDGTRVRSYFSGFRTDKFEPDEDVKEIKKEEHKVPLIEFETDQSIFDDERADCFAQYASTKGTPLKKWDEVTTTVSDLDTSKLHFVKVPENHIVIDFDIRGDDGKKSLGKNIEAASKWPPTYAELSKSGCGVHLHYIYTGDVSKLSRIYDDNIEIKVFTGKSSLRRKLTKCNNLPIATLTSGLPLKGDNNVVNFEGIKSEKALRTLIKRHLNKEIMGATKPSIDMIYKILDDAYVNGMKYDISDMQNAVFAFAASSTNQAEYCIKLVNKMPFKSDEPSEPVNNGEDELVFYDVEVFPNLFIVNWKFAGEGKTVVRMINPKPSEIEDLMRFNLVGFNCRRYDNHILYARLMGYDNEQLYQLSQRIVNGNRDAFFGEAYNVSYTDVYDFAATKQSLKKWEIELGIHHQELGLPWDQPVPEERWVEVAEYCDNDVIATEAVFNHLKADFTARKILADLAGGTVNDTTNSLSTKFIFGNNRKPQDQFNYRDMGECCESDYISEGFDEYTRFTKDGKPIFPGYKYEFGKSTYRGEEVGEGGYVYAEPGIHTNVALLDVASMHPASIIAEELFGPVFTKRFQDIRDARVAIKHKDFEAAKKMLDGKLAKYLNDPQMAADLAQALKIVINSVYGLTAAKFDNQFRDRRNKDNIVAKRGALFMVNLKHEVQKRGFTVAHIKTDSIKIPNATPEIIQFVMDYGKQYGYTFEHEATYDRMCLVNDAVYIARYRNDDGTQGDWTATGAQFAVPYVFKTLFSKEPIVFEDMCEAKSVTTALYLDMNEGLTDVSIPETVKALRQKTTDQRTKKEQFLLDEWRDWTEEELDKNISEGHDYKFVGKVGNFCPIKPGFGGGELVREAKDKNGNLKYMSATGAKDYRWLESELVNKLGDDSIIDRSYYRKLVDGAVKAISDYGDFEWFVSDDPVEEEKPKLDLPPWLMACGKETCEGCNKFVYEGGRMTCTDGHDISDLKYLNMKEIDSI
jgi:hypothetical protein